jgi:hypothetical protein
MNYEVRPADVYPAIPKGEKYKNTRTINTRTNKESRRSVLFQLALDFALSPATVVA